MAAAVRYLAPLVKAIIVRKHNSRGLSDAESTGRVAIVESARPADHRPFDLEVLFVLSKSSYMGGEFGRHLFQLTVEVERPDDVWFLHRFVNSGSLRPM